VPLSVVLLLGGTFVYLWGFWDYVKYKGYHGAWGLLALLIPIGPVVLLCFPKRQKKREASDGNE